LHGYPDPTPLADVDVLFFDANEVAREREAAIEAALGEALPHIRASVKNQARMHRRNGDAPYADTTDALRFWLETPTAVAIRIGDDGAATLLAPSASRICWEWCVVRHRAVAGGCRSTNRACGKELAGALAAGAHS